MDQEQTQDQTLPEDQQSPEFQQEQAHLDEVYGKLLDARKRYESKLEKTKADAAKDLSDMRDDIALDQSSDVHTETMAELQSVNAMIDSYSRTASVAEDSLRRTELLLQQPYFAKVSLQFKPDRPARDIYLGVAGATDEDERHFIVDWRSPVAETYYNQENGRTSYKANGRTIEVDLKCRRQFDITRDHLNNMFDTTIAIEDPLLLRSLNKHHSEKLQAITATIQKEQNDIVRHEDVPVLLVNGIAGSGKTSVLLQRIAYLFYSERETLRPDQVHLLTPNPVFERYIDNVLPDMGETNPQIFTWRDFLDKFGVGGRGEGTDTTRETLKALEAGMDGLKLQPNDVREIRIGEVHLLKAQQIQGVINKYAKRIPVGPHLVSVVIEDLHDRLDQRLNRLVNDDRVRDEMLDLDVDRQVEIFGSVISPETDEEIAECAKTYVHNQYDRAHDIIESCDWLRVDRIGMRILGAKTLSSVEWLYTKMLLTGMSDYEARYVMVDEVQDYTEAQLMCLARWFKNANFLLLGDEHQAIKEGTATFPQVKRLFEESHGEVTECRLMTSYRSSPEITELFCSLLDPDERIKTSSVHRPGLAPTIAAYAHEDIYRNVLRGYVRKAQDDEGLTAIIAATRGTLKRLFEESHGEVTECRLMTSYRSSPEITELFCSLLDPDERIKTSSVHRPGLAPTIAAYAHEDIYRNVLRGYVRKAQDDEGLTAIIAATRGTLKRLSKFLGDLVTVMTGKEALPGSGVVLMDLPSAKGLEFDHVILADAQAENFPDTPLARRRLYTAISRATHRVTILAQGELTPLLAGR